MQDRRKLGRHDGWPSLVLEWRLPRHDPGPTMTRRFLLVPLLLALAGCDQVNQRLGLEDPAKKEARVQAEGRAVGSACRQSGRAIEDCYTIYYWLPKSPIFEGWREMNDYMIANKLETVQPQFEPPGSPGEARAKRAKAAEEAKAAEPKGETKAETKTEAKTPDKAIETPAAKTTAKP